MKSSGMYVTINLNLKLHSKNNKVELVSHFENMC